VISAAASRSAGAVPSSAKPRRAAASSVSADSSSPRPRSARPSSTRHRAVSYRAEPLPYGAGPPQQWHRGRRVAGLERDERRRVVGARLHRGAAERTRDGFKLSGDGSGLVVMIGGQQHLPRACAASGDPPIRAAAVWVGFRTPLRRYRPSRLTSGRVGARSCCGRTRGDNEVGRAPGSAAGLCDSTCHATQNSLPSGSSITT
jgi:hypothetical protein